MVELFSTRPDFQINQYLRSFFFRPNLINLYVGSIRFISTYQHGRITINRGQISKLMGRGSGSGVQVGGPGRGSGSGVRMKFFGIF